MYTAVEIEALDDENIINNYNFKVQQYVLCMYVLAGAGYNFGLLMCPKEYYLVFMYLDKFCNS